MDQDRDTAPRVEPYIPASTTLPEITIKAVLLGIVLSIVLAGANAYLGLKAGMTVSASIPAAVISMAILRLFPRSNILENNIVQTAASAGESLAAGVIFTLPALILLRAWTDFDYWQTTVIAGLGGMIGVLFTIPLRRALIVDSPLTFPEGVATAEVLKVGDEGGGGVWSIVIGAVVGAVFKIGEAGIRVWAGVVEGGHRIGGSILYGGTNVSPALLGVGYIVGLNIAVLVVLGGALNWYGAIPYISANMDWPTYELIESGADAPWHAFAASDAHPAGTEVDATTWANTIWSKRTRYIGVGAMVVGGLWALLRLWGSLVRGIRSSIRAYREARDGSSTTLRTDRDTPMNFVCLLLALSVIPIFFVFRSITDDTTIAMVMAIVMLVAGFLFSAVASYMAGLVGSSNNPISGVTIATLLTSALLLFALDIDPETGPAAAILIGAVVCCAAAIGGDNMQDLKAGQLVGATPYKQQIMQVIGVGAAALVMAPVLSALLNAYGIGPITVEGQDPLEAPQASLMQSVAEGVFERNLPWPMINIGMGVAAVVIVIDLLLERAKSSFRAPVLAVAVGIYLPLELTVPIFFGGVIAWLAGRWHTARIAAAPESEREEMEARRTRAGRRGLLLAAGLITGEALLGILLAIPLAAWEGDNKIAGWFSEVTGMTSALVWPGLFLLAGVMFLMYRTALNGRE